MIYIITQRDPYFTDEFFRVFDEFNIPFIIFDLPNFKTGKSAGVKNALKLYGLIGFVKLLVKLVFSKKYYLRFKNVVEIKRVGSISALLPTLESLSDDDILLSVSAPARIPIEVVKSKSLMLNIHCGRLPEYAGMMPIFWQVYDERQEIIITLHHMAEKIDEGCLISETKIPVAGTFFELSQNAKAVSARLFVETIKERGNIESTQSRQNKIFGLKKFPSAADVSKVKQRRKMI